MMALKTTGMAGCVDLVFLSDHGMSDAGCDRRVDVDEFFRNFSGSTLDHISSFHRDGPVTRVRLKNSTEGDLKRIKT
jgi:hypothetical protein